VVSSSSELLQSFDTRGLKLYFCCSAKFNIHIENDKVFKIFHFILCCAD